MNEKLLQSTSMFTIKQIKEMTKGVLIQGDEALTVKRVSIDSRTIKKDEVFIAVKGDRFNGHDFIRKAVENGARAVIVGEKIICPSRIAVIRVKDTTKALGRIAAWHRAQFSIPVIAITGSTGKTTTKEMAAAVLSKRFKVLKNIGTQNNHFGVPLTLLKLNSSHKTVVIELGTNQPGDIRWLAQIVRPTIAIFTNIGESHLEKLKTPSGVLREKMQLINYMKPKGTVIFNGDDPYLASISVKHRGKKLIRFGCANKVNYRAGNISIKNNRSICFKLNNHIFTIHSSAAHNVYNALAAISCGLALKISYNDIIAALRNFPFRGSRQEIRKSGRFWLIDDTYNANPVSLKSAINTLDALHIKGKRIVVCADMLELGPRSKDLHRLAGGMIARSSADIVLTVGSDARYITEEFNRHQKPLKAQHCKDLSEIKRQLKRFCQPYDAILVKGSRAMRMERIVEFLSSQFH